MINVDSEVTVGGVAQSLAATLDGPAPALAPRFSKAALLAKDGVRDGHGPRKALWMDGRMLDPQALAVKELRDGAVVAVEQRGAAATVLAEPTGLVEVRVAGGPAAGSVHRLGLGTSTIGSGRDVDVVLDDPSVPARSLRLTVGREAVEVEPSAMTMQSSAALDGTPLGAKTIWPVGGMLSVGGSVLTLAPSAAPDTHLEPLPEGGLAFNRPPRLRPARHARTLDVPKRPERNPRERLRLFGALLFSAFGLVMAFALGQWWWALFALAWPVMTVGEWIGDRLHGRKSYKKALKDYHQKSGEFDGEMERLRRADEAERRALHPDPAEVLLTATGPRRRLWERRRDDADVLHLRVGLADLPARIELTGEPGDVPIPAARQVPVALPLGELGVIGLTGPRHASRGLARWLVAQAAVLHSPRDLAIVVLSAEQRAGTEWNWVRWLPHCAPREGEDCVALVGTDPESAAHRVTELAIRLTERRRAAQSESPFFGQAGGPSVPYNILIVLDGARALRRIPGMPMLLSRGAEYGLYAICVDDEERLLPEECQAVAAWEPQWPSLIRLQGQGLEAVGPVVADQVSATWSDRVARALAPVRDVSREDAEDSIPADVRLLDVLDMPEPTAEHVLQSWSRTGGRTTRVPIGLGSGQPYEVDLRTDGPHGLIAGTTGAGKSELLQTLIASLAVANRPDEMTFVLIDYKGGAAFKDCARLPHTVGMVTDLDGHATERALESLAAELRRREEILLEAGAKDVDDYNDVRITDPGLPAMPRLVLVIDEFAAMVTELPDFVTGLVDIGRRGRSLGVHLILATQRPAGVVTADIRANTNLRIALRVTDPDESTDVLDSPDAAQISKSTPGRCYVRSGVSSPHAVQSARIGGRRPGTAAAGGPTILPLPWQGLGHPLPAPREAADDSTMATDLGVLVQAIDEAARRAGIGRQPSPWLNPLPEQVRLTPRTAAGGSVVDVPPIPFGITDLPAVQSREELALDLASGGHLYLAGSAQSGRSTALRTIAGSLAVSCSPYDAHLYAIDCGANALLPLISLPHCGAVVTRDQLDRCERLLTALTAEVARRQQLLAEAGFASLAEQRTAVAATDRLPWMVLLLDRWEGFVGAFEHYDYGRLVDQVIRLLREGAAVGLRAVFTGDRSGLGGQVSTVFDRRLLLRMADPNDYGYGGLQDKQVPRRDAPRPRPGTDRPRRTPARIPGGPARGRPVRHVPGGGTSRDSPHLRLPLRPPPPPPTPPPRGRTAGPRHLPRGHVARPGVHRPVPPLGPGRRRRRHPRPRRRRPPQRGPRLRRRGPAPLRPLHHPPHDRPLAPRPVRGRRPRPGGPGHTPPLPPPPPRQPPRRPRPPHLRRRPGRPRRRHRRRAPLRRHRRRRRTPRRNGPGRRPPRRPPHRPRRRARRRHRRHHGRPGPRLPRLPVRHPPLPVRRPAVHRLPRRRRPVRPPPPPQRPPGRPHGPRPLRGHRSHHPNPGSPPTPHQHRLTPIEPAGLGRSLSPPNRPLLPVRPGRGSPP
ncbi:FtsK/SpoIIIE domain-containing protein [Actinomadura latina]|uniref:FtsK/SpoIIIE domain-containing protein n=1 Tax=Actinomadura latina TaxID=163603 RepID=UPI001FE137C1|nr:FtsK/SpoIIIE domain-containing protein [Actinomadura latina]